MSPFPLTATRQEITRFLVRCDIFQRILKVHGSIIECGVGSGAGLMTWAHLSAIYEPYNHTRRVIGFDTFTGFPAVSAHDKAEVGGMAFDSYEEITAAAKEADANRPIGHIPKVELVRGDATETMGAYVRAHPHLIVSLLYLDFDLYLPTVKALRWFRGLMPKGAVIVFDELNVEEWPGETVAVCQALDLPLLRIERCPFASTISWAQL